MLDSLPADRLLQLLSRPLIEAALEQFYVFTLVVVRMSGLMAIGPVFGQSVVPMNVRALLVLALSLLVTPALDDQSRRGFVRLDGDGDGRLVRDEIPEPLRPRFDHLLAQAGLPADGGLTFDEYDFTVAVPSTLLDYLWIVAGEFVLGLVLGVGVLIVLSGLQMAGQLIDQQSGIALGEIIHPDLGAASVTAQTLFLLGTTLLIVLEPLGGHLRVVAALIESFQTLPVGEAFVGANSVELLSRLVHQSMALAIRVAAPVLAVMSLAALAMGFLGHTVPQINVLVIGFAVRALMGLLILAVSLTGAAELLVETLPTALEQLRAALTMLD